MSDLVERLKRMERGLVVQRPLSTLQEAYETLESLAAERDRLAALVGGYELALEMIAVAGSDCPAGMTEVEFNEGQFRRCRSVARAALAAGKGSP